MAVKYKWMTRGYKPEVLGFGTLEIKKPVFKQREFGSMALADDGKTLQT